MSDPEYRFDSNGLDSELRAAFSTLLGRSPLSAEVKERVRARLSDAIALPVAGTAAGVTGTMAKAITAKGVLVTCVATTLVVGSGLILSRHPTPKAEPAPNTHQPARAANGQLRVSRPPPSPEANVLTRLPVPNGAASPKSVGIATRRATTKATLAEEAALLEQARAALANDPSQALLLVEQFDRRFAHPQLRAERDVIEMRALTLLRRPDDARRLHPARIYRDRAPEDTDHPKP